MRRYHTFIICAFTYDVLYNEGDTPHPSGYDFIAVWKMPNKNLAQQFEEFVENSGLHEYYEQVNTRGQMMEMGAVVEALLNPENP
jgi:hypothetical protein